MLRISRVATLATAATVAGVLWASAPAMAASYDVDAVTCAFAGLAGNLTPGVYSVSHTVTAALGGQLPPDTGTFQFTTDGAPLPTVCAVVSSNLNDDGNDNDTEVAVGTGHIHASGNYTNFVCGTGLATGSSAITADTPLVGSLDGGDLSATADFTIAFAGGHGALAITNARDGGGDSGSLPVVGGAGGGYVNIVPDALTPGAGDCVLNDVKQFRVTGAFTAAVPRVSAP